MDDNYFPVFKQIFKQYLEAIETHHEDDLSRPPFDTPEFRRSFCELIEGICRRGSLDKGKKGTVLIYQYKDQGFI